MSFPASSPRNKAQISAAPRTIPLPKPPKHLSPEAAKWWRGIVKEWNLEPHNLRVLQAAAEAWDRLQQAREVLAAHGGLTIQGPRGGLYAHPAVAIERDARIGFARLVRELELEEEAPPERGRMLFARRKGSRL